MSAPQTVELPSTDAVRKTPYTVYGEIVSFGCAALILATFLISIGQYARQRPLTLILWLELLAIGLWLAGMVSSGRRIRRFVRDYALPNAPDPRPIFPLALTVVACVAVFLFSFGSFLGDILGTSSSRDIPRQLFQGSMAGLALGSLLLFLLACRRISRITRSLADAMHPPA